MALNLLCLGKLEKPYYGFANPEKPLNVLGFCVAELAWRTKRKRAVFLVMKGIHQNLIGIRSATAFGMVTLNLGDEKTNDRNLCMVSNQAQPSKEKLAEMFPDLFSGKLGCIKDTEVKLEVDINVKPVKQPLRTIAFHYRDAVEKEVEKQVSDGILEKVDASTGPITHGSQT